MQLSLSGFLARFMDLPSPLGATDSAANAAVAPPSSSSAAAGTGTSNVTMNAGYLEW